MPEELVCLSPHALPVRRRDFCLGRTAAHRALRALGHPVVPIPIGPGRAPLWPPGVVGSISHAGGSAVAAVARGGAGDARGPGDLRGVAALGLDLEVIRPLEAGVASLIADTAERAWIGGDAARLILLFSAKESIFKALYPLHGAFFDFDAVHLDPLSPLPEAQAPGAHRQRPVFAATLRQPIGPYPAGARLTVTGVALTVGGTAAVLTMVSDRYLTGI